MGDILSLISHHGYALIALAVFLEAIGVPVPAALALLAAGTASAVGKLRLGLVFASTVPAMVTGDALLFTVGRYTGWTLLGLLCRISVNPETCILRSAESFYRRGKMTLVLAKFIPGINTMAPPLAGSMNMRPFQFLRLDAAGAKSLYISAYVTAGFVFSGFFENLRPWNKKRGPRRGVGRSGWSAGIRRLPAAPLLEASHVPRGAARDRGRGEAQARRGL